MSVTAHVFISTTNPGPREVCRAVRKLEGVVRADALFGGPPVVAIIEADDLASVDLIVDAIVALEAVTDTNTHIARSID